MDHFIGFDRLLRLFLGRRKSLCMFGPKGFLSHIEGKLAGYTWDLVHNYSNGLTITACEILNDEMITQSYSCSARFVPAGKPLVKPHKPVLLDEPAWSVSATILDHSIPCLGLSIEERFHINIKKDRLMAMGLEAGPWLNEFKNQLYQRQNLDAEITFAGQQGMALPKGYSLKALAQQIALITPGQKITYITDVVFSPENVEKMVALAKDSDWLYIEAPFLDKHRDIAFSKNHLTAKQAGTIAGMARVKQIRPFHFSPRYTGHHHLIIEEAISAYHSALRQTTGSPPT
jgi:ribonuclease Z